MLNVSQGWIPTYHSRSHGWLSRKKWLSFLLTIAANIRVGTFFFPLWVGAGGAWAPGNRPVNFVSNLLKGYWPCFESPVIMMTWLWWQYPQHPPSQPVSPLELLNLSSEFENEKYLFFVSWIFNICLCNLLKNSSDI